MQRDDTTPFHVKISKTKVLIAIPIYLVFDLVMLAAGFGAMALAYTGEAPDFAMMFLEGPVCIMIGGVSIWAAVNYFMSLRDDKLIALITIDGFSARRFNRWHEFSWTPTTEMTRYKSVVVLRNPPGKPSLKEFFCDLWSPKHGVGINNAYAAQSHKDVEAAVARLNPYFEA